MKRILNIFWDFINSFKTTDGGFSARKVTAFAATMAGIKISVVQANAENAFLLTCANYTLALLCLGLVTTAQLITLKTGQTITTTENTVEKNKTVVKNEVPVN